MLLLAPIAHALRVAAMDATGLVSLESAVARLHQLGMYVVLGGVQGQPLRVLARSGIHDRRDRIAVYRTMERALSVARDHSRIPIGALPVVAADSAPSH